MKKIYLAGPFFNKNERDLIEKASKILRSQDHQVIVPMEHIIEGGDKMTNEEWSRHVFQYDVARIRECDIVIAIYHGHYSDTGTAWELGYAKACTIPSIVVHVDVNHIASIMPVSGCSCNIRFEDLEKIDIDNIISYCHGHQTSINAWIVEQK